MKEVLSYSKMSTFGWTELREVPHWLQQRHHQVSYCILMKQSNRFMQFADNNTEGGTSVYYIDYVKGRHIGAAHSLDITQ